MRKVVLFTFLLSGLLYLASCSMSDDTVAKVGGEKISAEVFKQNLSRRFGPKDSYAEVDSAVKMSMLNRMILNKMKAMDGEALGLENDEAYAADIKMLKSRMLSNRYFEKLIVDKLIPESELRAEFDKNKEQVKASHILIAYKGAQRSTVKRSKEKAAAIAGKLAEQAKNGADFGMLAEKNSDGPSAKSKGDLGYFSRGRMAPSFEKAAFALKTGEISGVVETPFGFHIIKVEDRRTNPSYNAANFDKEKLNLKRKLYPAKQDSGAAMWKRQSEALRTEYGYKVLDENIVKLADAAKTKKPGAGADAYTDEEKNLPLAEWSGGKLVLNDIFGFYGKRFRMLEARLKSKEALTQEVNNAALLDIVIQDAEKMGIDKEPDIQTQLQNAKDSKLAGLAEKHEVRDKAVASDAEIITYYDEHSNEYERPAQMEIWEIYVTKENLAKKIARKAKAGQNFEKLASRYSEDKYYQKKKGYLGFKAENRRGAVSKEAFKIGSGKIGGPVKYRNGWAVIKTGKLKEKALRPFKEVATQVKNKVQNMKSKDLRAAWEKELRSKYSVKINTALVEKI